MHQGGYSQKMGTLVQPRLESDWSNHPRLVLWGLKEDRQSTKFDWRWALITSFVE
jgi:hypothetical protein